MRGAFHRGNVAATGLDAGCADVVFERATTPLWEVRRRHVDRGDYLAEIAARAGRSLLHELTDAELALFVDEFERRLPEGPLVEQGRWTIWGGVRA